MNRTIVFKHFTITVKNEEEVEDFIYGLGKLCDQYQIDEDSSCFHYEVEL